MVETGSLDMVTKIVQEEVLIKDFVRICVELGSNAGVLLTGCSCLNFGGPETTAAHSNAARRATARHLERMLKTNMGALLSCNRVWAGMSASGPVTEQTAHIPPQFPGMVTPHCLVMKNTFSMLTFSLAAGEPR
ncbi:hypothetical protein EJB05_22995 [Eragrostis curvula]|uniref:Uncharacterized protein n=1 Tax=Eragrostis curvula TaxID=38414 RepID=A0A5J9V5W0_9POAL|nr:hypothetical protein EJB05_22995 [Eragrostis curvula]